MLIDLVNNIRGALWTMVNCDSISQKRFGKHILD
jgi:hypothetical protein